MRSRPLHPCEQAEPRHHPADAHTHRTARLVDAHRDHRLLEPRIADARHRQQKLALKGGLVRHAGHYKRAAPPVQPALARAGQPDRRRSTPPFSRKDPL